MVDLSPEMVTALMFGGLLIGIFIGHPLAFVLGGLGAIFGFFIYGPGAFGLIVNRIYSTMDSYILTAVPLFILMANILDQSGVTQKLFETMRYIFGPVRGGLAVAVIVVCTLFGACTGIIGATVVTMGVLALPLMLKYGYNKRMTCGVVSAGGTLGILIPPSVMLIVMGDLSGVSVGKLYAGAIIPGLILAALYVVYILVKCYRRPEMGPPVSAEERAALSRKELAIMVSKSMVPPTVLISGVLGSIFAGVATPTEAAGVGAFLAVLLTCAYGKFTWNGLYSAIIQTTKTASMVLMIVVGATSFTGVFLGIGGGKVVENFILGLGFEKLGTYFMKWGTYFIMMVILFVFGMFIDWIGIVMITFPVFLPIADKLGFDKLWFVVSCAVMMQDCFLTPPFGGALFYLKGVAPPEVTITDIYWGVVPFWELMEVALIIVVIFPETITWLPSVLVK